MLKNARDVVKTMTQKSERRSECFEKIIDMCMKKIIRSATLNMTSCFFEVPEFIIGFPLFNINECLLYVIKRLQGAGYGVKYYFPRVLHISWATPEIEKRKLETHLISLIEHPVVDVPLLSHQEHDKEASEMKDVKSKNGGKGRKKKVKPIAEYKPSGKFVLNI